MLDHNLTTFRVRSALNFDPAHFGFGFPGRVPTLDPCVVKAGGLSKTNKIMFDTAWTNAWFRPRAQIGNCTIGGCRYKVAPFIHANRNNPKTDNSLSACFDCFSHVHPSIRNIPAHFVRDQKTSIKQNNRQGSNTETLSGKRAAPTRR